VQLERKFREKKIIYAGGFESTMSFFAKLMAPKPKPPPEAPKVVEKKVKAPKETAAEKTARIKAAAAAKVAAAKAERGEAPLVAQDGAEAVAETTKMASDPATLAAAPEVIEVEPEPEPEPEPEEEFVVESIRDTRYTHPGKGLTSG
jgi:hypothetical protein